MTFGVLLFAVLLITLPLEGRAAIDAQEVYVQANPSVVTIILSGGGQGSGFSVGRKNYIATNYHVIRGLRARSIMVRLTSGKEVKIKRIVGVDKKRDLALLQLISAPKSLLPLPLLVEDVAIGSDVAAIGTPYGLSSTITTGVVSAIRRKCQVEAEENYKKTFSTCYQTSTAINPGNSGGPLLNSEGMVIGINTFIYRGAEGLGFSVHATHLADLMRSKGIPAPVRVDDATDAQRTAKSIVEIKKLPKGSYKAISDEIDRKLKQAALEIEQEERKNIRDEKEFEDSFQDSERPRKSRNPRALFDAIGQGNVDTVSSELKKGVDVNGKFDGMTPLMAAAISNHPQIISLLLSQRASTLMVDGMRQTALIHASKLGKVESVRELLQSQREVNQLDDNGRSALMHAAIVGSKEIVEALIDAGSDYLLRDFGGNTARDLASINSHSSISVYLFQVKYRAEKDR